MAFLNNEQKRIIQFKELVIDNGLITQGESVSYKNTEIDFVGKSGTYAPNTGVHRNSGSVDVELLIPLRGIPKNILSDYKSFIAQNLEGRGRLWAVCGNDLMWAWATVTDVTLSYSRSNQGSLSRAVRFSLPEGVWHKADPLKVYLEDYYSCNFDTGCHSCGNCEDDRCANVVAIKTKEEEEELSDLGQHVDCVNCKKFDASGKVLETYKGVCVECKAGGCCSRTKNLESLCEALKKDPCCELFADRCNKPKRIVYSCNEQDNRFGKLSSFGQKFDSLGNSFISSTITSSTVVPSSQVIVRLVGCFINPKIQIGVGTVEIEGEYEGMIIINAETGEIWYSNSKEYDHICTENLIGLSNVSQTPYFKIEDCNTRIYVSGIVAPYNSSVYVDHERLI